MADALLGILIEDVDTGSIDSNLDLIAGLKSAVKHADIYYNAEV